MTGDGLRTKAESKEPCKTHIVEIFELRACATGAGRALRALWHFALSLSVWPQTPPRSKNSPAHKKGQPFRDQAHPTPIPQSVDTLRLGTARLHQLDLLNACEQFSQTELCVEVPRSLQVTVEIWHGCLVVQAALAVSPSSGHRLFDMKSPGMKSTLWVGLPVGPLGAQKQQHAQAAKLETRDGKAS